MPYKKKNTHRKSRGRPPGSRYAGNIPCRLESETLAAVDRFAAQEHVRRSEAIRRLVTTGLADLTPFVLAKRSASLVPKTGKAGQDEKRRLTSAQIRAGRALVRWSAEDLSRHSAVSLRTIRRAELVEGQTSLTDRNDLAIRRALESAGVEFINGDQPGVRLTKAVAARSTKYVGRAVSTTRDKTRT